MTKRFVIASAAVVALACGPTHAETSRETRAGHVTRHPVAVTPPSSGTANAAVSETPAPDPITIDADGLVVGDPGREPGVWAKLGDTEISFRDVRLVYTANAEVQLRAETEDASLLLPIVLDPADVRCIERQLGRSIGTGRLALGFERYSARVAYRLRVEEVDRRAYDATRPQSSEGQQVGTFSGTLLAAFESGEYSPLSGWVVGVLVDAPVIQLGDPGREESCSGAHRRGGRVRGTYQGAPTELHPVALMHYPQSDDRYPSGYELQLSDGGQRLLQIRFSTPPRDGLCVERRSGHEVDPGPVGARVPRFRLELSHYDRPVGGRTGAVSGYVRAEFRPDTVFEGTFHDVPVQVVSGTLGPRACEDLRDTRERP